MVDARDEKGKILLHDAVKNNDYEKIKELVKNGADINAKDEEGETALHWAAWNNAYETARLLLENGA